MASVSAFFFSGRFNRTVRTAASSVTRMCSVISSSRVRLVRSDAVSNQSADGAKFAAGGGPGLCLDNTVQIDDLLADCGHHSAAAPRPAAFGGDSRLAQRPVDLFDEKPSAAIRHAERPCRG